MIRKSDILLIVLIAVLAVGLGACTRGATERSTDGSAAISGRSGTGSKTASPAKTPISLTRTGKVKVYLVKTDKSSTGDTATCDAGLIAVERSVRPTSTPLRAAIDELLSVPERLETGDQSLGNFVKGDALRTDSVEIKNGVATIAIAGRFNFANACDRSRVLSQIDATARQFSNIKSVNININGAPLTVSGP